ncbi:DUF1289 domain-containing protein [Dyella kyungheensis]|uniref:DUF1289 domain-containing protein n=1 Tax=Dyella kyungheensis TaxID=1242174 RepID=UPI003CEEA1D8
MKMVKADAACPAEGVARMTAQAPCDSMFAYLARPVPRFVDIACSMTAADCSPGPTSNPLSPCIGICRLDPRGYCIGCLRTGDEIARWRAMDDDERRRYMRDVLPTRKLP